MRNPWQQVRLEQVLRLDLNPVFVDAVTTYPMVGVLSFGRGLFEREPIENGRTSYKKFYRLKAEHVVMSQLFGWEGALALSSEQYEGKFLSPQFPTFLCDRNKLDRNFLGWFMRRPAFWEDLGSRASGMGDRRRTLNPEALFACEIPLPPLPKQQRIVARIKALAAKIDRSHSLRKSTEEDSENLCRSLIFSSTRSSKLTPMCDLVSLKEPDVSVKSDEIYHFAGVYCFGKGVFRGQKKSGMDFSYPILTKIRKGNFVYPKLMAWEGALGIVPSECDGLVVSPEFPVFEVNVNQVLPEVLDVYFRTPSVWPLLAGASIGTNVRRRRLNPKDFFQYKMPLPSMSIQEKLAIVKTKVNHLKKLNDETAAELNALLPSILDKAFKGEL